MKAFWWATASVISASLFAFPGFAQPLVTGSEPGRITIITVDPSDPTGNAQVGLTTSVRMSSGGNTLFVKRNLIHGRLARVEVRLGKVKHVATPASLKSGKWNKRFKLAAGRNVISVRLVGQDGSTKRLKKVVHFRPQKS